MTKRAQWLTLCILLGIWAGVAIWVVADAPEPQRVPLRYVTGRASRTEAIRSEAGGGLKVNRDLLAAARRRADKAFVAPKNIFALLPTEKTENTERMARPRAKPPAPVPARAPAVAAPVVPPPPSPEELAAQAVRQELDQFRYLGYLSRDGRVQAFLSKGKELYIVKSDEMIEQRVLVKTVTPTGVTLQDPRSRVERTIQLVEGR